MKFRSIVFVFLMSLLGVQSTAFGGVWAKVVASAADLMGAMKVKNIDDLLEAATNQTSKSNFLNSVENFRKNIVKNADYFTDVKMTAVEIDQAAFGIALAKGFTDTMNKSQWDSLAASPATIGALARRSMLKHSQVQSYQNGLNGALASFDADAVTKSMYLRVLQEAEGNMSPEAFANFRKSLSSYMDDAGSLKLADIPDVEVNKALGRAAGDVAQETQEAFEKFFKAVGNCE
ncbi:MAG: hypothetical protein CMP10_20795 [Zetaproteobacteria bacterium]|nr:hypothetical protein [Pseudobdellovibrionaceae bacterium]